MNTSRTRLVSLLLMLSTIAAVSPLIQQYSPVRRSAVCVLAALAILVVKLARGGLNQKYFLACLGVIALAGVPAFHWQEPHFYFLPIYLVLSLLTLAVLDKGDIEHFVRLLSGFMLIVLIGAVVGTLYAYFGGPPLLEFPNEDGRLNQLYLTTLTNFQVLNLIRPSGIFDEPGALSFFVCLTVALRHALGHGKKMSWALLSLGLITTSVAHLIFMMLYTAESLKGRKNAKAGFVALGTVAVSMVILITFIKPLQDIFSSLLFDRFSSGNLGDDRQFAFQYGLKYLHQSFLFGLNPDCALGIADCMDKGYGYYGETPLTLIVHWGIFLAFPYYLMLAYLLASSLRRLDFVMLGVFLLLLQRPYTMTVGYSTLILLSVFLLAERHARKNARGPSPASGTIPELSAA